MECPRCVTAVLEAVQYEGVTIDVCNQCGGQFLDHDELGHIIHAREMRFDEAARQLVAEREPVFGVPTDEIAHDIKCPKCTTVMKTLNYSCDSGVYIDSCPACGGFWLDADELETVQIYQEEWEEKAPEMIKAVAGRIAEDRLAREEKMSNAFQGSRFAFVNALINRLLDAA